MARQIQANKMGKRKRRDGYKVKSSSRRRRTNRSNLSIASISGFDYGFPDSLKTKLRYGEAHSTTLAANTLNNYVYRLNSLFDPDFSGTGRQPMYFDQFCGATSPYRKYRVLGAKIKVTYAITSPPDLVTANVSPVMVALYTAQVNSTNIVDQNDIIEKSGSNYGILGDKSGGNSTVTLTNTYSPRKDMAQDPRDDTLASLYNNNPANPFYAMVLMHGQSNATVRVFVEIDYVVEFFERNDITGS